MASTNNAHANWLRRISELRNRLTEAEDTLNAIRNGAVDALVVRTPRGEQLFTLKGADQTYRVLVEGMHEGAFTVKRGIISYCNRRFAEMVRTPMEKVFGASVLNFVVVPRFTSLIKRVEKGKTAPGTLEGELRCGDGAAIPVLLSVARFHLEGAPAASVLVTDIAERRNAEKAL